MLLNKSPQNPTAPNKHLFFLLVGLWVFCGWRVLVVWVGLSVSLLLGPGVPRTESMAHDRNAEDRQTPHAALPLATAGPGG